MLGPSFDDGERGEPNDLLMNEEGVRLRLWGRSKERSDDLALLAPWHAVADHFVADGCASDGAYHHLS